MRSILFSFTLMLTGCGDQALVAEAEEATASLLIDSSAAQFRNVEVVDGIVCGEVNGKNRFGAYVGFKRFFAIRNEQEVTPVIYDEDLFKGHTAEAIIAMAQVLLPTFAKCLPEEEEFKRLLRAIEAPDPGDAAVDPES